MNMMNLYSKMFTTVVTFMIYRDVKKSDNRPYKIFPNTDVSVAENGPMLTNHQPIDFLITFIFK